MRSLWASRLSIGFAVLLSAALVSGAGLYLSRTTSDARARVFADADARAGVSADLIGGLLVASDAKTRAVSVAQFSGTVAQLEAQRGTTSMDAAWYAILGADGGLLAADPASASATARTLAADPGFGIAARTGKLAFGDVLVDSGVVYVLAFQPFDAPDGPRTLALPIAVDGVADLLAGSLRVPSASSYVLDGAGRVIVATDRSVAGSPLPRRDLAAALRAGPHGVAGDEYFIARTIPGSDWRVVMTTPQRTLLAPVQATGRVAWQLFAAFAVAMTVILLIGLSALMSSARLARARLHDALTGLPNRALFMERADAVSAEWRRRRQTRTEGTVAALFLDLDGFKPVNDTYGHATGDALLKQVAARLIAATRPEDFVSRFGGDEFLVLCRGLRNEGDAFAVADRIRAYLTEPFDLNGRTVEVGVSIGIATLGEAAQEPGDLIHNADLALYRAKENGRGRVEFFTAATP
ncbi:diguanylate cyclase [Catenuloplanes japonicus]|uniref:diguanylate cyclase n=1 Tax=Catenuloplanes japonicus TaxID=33876 RepID=UPI00068E83C2|nr:diguanylate cyclase [Catenuloplanes japonicus]